MKRIILLSIFLLGLLPYLQKGKICIAISSANAQTMGEEDGPVEYNITTDDGKSYMLFDNDGDGTIDKLAYLDSNGDPVIVALQQPHIDLNPNNVADAMSTYDPTQWTSPDIYLDYWGASYYAAIDPPAASTIKNNVTKACIKSVVNSVLNPSVPNTLSNKLNSIFTSSGNYKLEFDEVYSTGSGKSETSMSTTPDSDGKYLITINLLRSDLDYGSQEYKAAVIIHEAFHALLLANPSPETTGTTAQHIFMLQKYTTVFANELKQLFPGPPQMDDITAKALAMGGYGDVDSTTFQAELTKQGLTLSQVTSINADHHNGFAGTSCQ